MLSVPFVVGKMASPCVFFFFFCSASQQESWEESELFKPQPSSDVDALGKKRYVGEFTRRRGAESEN